MTRLLSVLTPIGLLDAVSITPLAIVPLLAALGTRRPVRTSLSLLAGLFLPYFGFGVVIALGLSSLFDALSERFDQWLHRPDALDMWLQLAIGAVCLALGMKLARARENHDDRGAGEEIGAAQAFSIGAALTVVGLPGALPYFAAIDQLLRADLDLSGSLLALAYYDFVCATPLLLVMGVRLALGPRSDAFFGALADRIGRFSHRVIVAGLSILGAVMLVDAIAWMHGQPLIKL